MSDVIEVTAADEQVILIHPDEIIKFRVNEFLGMGFDEEPAYCLANTRHDVHAVRRMLKQGCSAELAMGILL